MLPVSGILVRARLGGTGSAHLVDICKKVAAVPASHVCAPCAVCRVAHVIPKCDASFAAGQAHDWRLGRGERR